MKGLAPQILHHGSEISHRIKKLDIPIPLIEQNGVRV
jgi:hypothetical protein